MDKAKKQRTKKSIKSDVIIFSPQELVELGILQNIQKVQESHDPKSKANKKRIIDVIKRSIDANKMQPSTSTASDSLPILNSENLKKNIMGKLLPKKVTTSSQETSNPQKVVSSVKIMNSDIEMPKISLSNKIIPKTSESGRLIPSLINRKLKKYSVKPVISSVTTDKSILNTDERIKEIIMSAVRSNSKETLQDKPELSVSNLKSALNRTINQSTTSRDGKISPIENDRSVLKPNMTKKLSATKVCNVSANVSLNSNDETIQSHGQVITIGSMVNKGIRVVSNKQISLSKEQIKILIMPKTDDTNSPEKRKIDTIKKKPSVSDVETMEGEFEENLVKSKKSIIVKGDTSGHVEEESSEMSTYLSRAQNKEVNTSKSSKEKQTGKKSIIDDDIQDTNVIETPLKIQVTGSTEKEKSKVTTDVKVQVNVNLDIPVGKTKTKLLIKSKTGSKENVKTWKKLQSDSSAILLNLNKDDAKKGIFPARASIEENSFSKALDTNKEVQIKSEEPSESHKRNEVATQTIETEESLYVFFEEIATKDDNKVITEDEMRQVTEATVGPSKCGTSQEIRMKLKDGSIMETKSANEIIPDCGKVVPKKRGRPPKKSLDSLDTQVISPDKMSKSKKKINEAEQEDTQHEENTNVFETTETINKIAIKTYSSHPRRTSLLRVNENFPTNVLDETSEDATKNVQGFSLNITKGEKSLNDILKQSEPLMKNPIPAGDSMSSQSGDPLVKVPKKRGRPRKNPLEPPKSKRPKLDFSFENSFNSSLDDSTSDNVEMGVSKSGRKRRKINYFDMENNYLDQFTETKRKSYSSDSDEDRKQIKITKKEPVLDVKDEPEHFISENDIVKNIEEKPENPEVVSDLVPLAGDIRVDTDISQVGETPTKTIDDEPENESKDDKLKNKKYKWTGETQRMIQSIFSASMKARTPQGDITEGVPAQPSDAM